MIPHSRAYADLGFLAVDKKIAALKSIGVDDFGNKIKYRLVNTKKTNNDANDVKRQRHAADKTLERIEHGSTGDELLSFLGPFCSDITNILQESMSQHDMYEPLVEALEQHYDLDYHDSTKFVGCTHFDSTQVTINGRKFDGRRRVGSLSFQYNIVAHKQHGSWIAIEKLTQIDQLCQAISLPVVFELNDPCMFHDWFSEFPGIIATTKHGSKIVELCDAVRTHRDSGDQCSCGNTHMPCISYETRMRDANLFLDVSKLVFTDGTFTLDDQPVEFVFGV